MSPDPYDRVIAALEARGTPVRNGMACCPAHDDQDPSLTVHRGTTQPVVVNCYAGCPTDKILAALGLAWPDICSGNGNGDRSTLVSSYPYTDEHGVVLFHVDRYEGKRFAQQPANGRTGKGAMKGIRRVLYVLPAVVKAVKDNQRVFVVEGEKDADALSGAGVVATCNPGGAGKWHTVPDAVDVLSGAVLVVTVADRDDPGRAHARDVWRSLEGHAERRMIVEAKTGKDAADHLAAGHSIEEFEVYADDAEAVQDQDAYLRGTAPGNSEIPDQIDEHAGIVREGDSCRSCEDREAEFFRAKGREKRRIGIDELRELIAKVT